MNSDISKYGHLRAKCLYFHKQTQSFKCDKIIFKTYHPGTKSAKFNSFWIKNNDHMHYFIQWPSGIKNEIIAYLYPLGTSPAFHYMFYIYLGGYNSSTTKDIKFKLSAILSYVGTTKCVKFQRPRCRGLKVIDLRLAIDPLPPRGNFVHYDFLKLQYISHKMRHVSPLRVEALSCNNNITYVTL